MTSILIVVVALLLAWVAFKVVTFVASGCLKLVIYAVLLAIIGSMVWYQLKGH